MFLSIPNVKKKITISEWLWFWVVWENKNVLKSIIIFCIHKSSSNIIDSDTKIIIIV